MIEKRTPLNMGETNIQWLYSLHHFSFGDYYDEKNAGIGPLKVINDDIISSNQGFETHPHRNMEILTYVLEGVLTHKDSLSNKVLKLEAGNMQYMSAGSGIFHSEKNMESTPLRLIQIWITPVDKDILPSYGQINFKWEDRINSLLHMVSSHSGKAPIKINQDVDIYSVLLEKDHELKIKPKEGKILYISVLEGSCQGNNLDLKKYEVLLGDEEIELKASSNCHMLIFEISFSF